MADIYYNSTYTGSEVDASVRDKVLAVKQSDFNALNAASMPTSKIYIITDGTNINTLWRSNGISKVQLTGGSSVSGVKSIGGATGVITLGGSLDMNENELFTTYSSTAPTADNEDGYKIAILSSEPTTYYAGWIYYILED